MRLTKKTAARDNRKKESLPKRALRFVCFVWRDTHTHTQLLRDELGWDGMLVTDWSEIRNQHDWHRVAATAADAVEMAMTETTIDMSMVPTTLRDWQPDGLGEITSAVTSFNTDMAALTAAGKVSQQRVDVAAGRVLQLKEELGLLDDPMLDAARALIPTVGQPEDRAVATDIARESLVLLRNRMVRWGGGHGAAAAGGGGTEAESGRGSHHRPGSKLKEMSPKSCEKNISSRVRGRAW